MQTDLLQTERKCVTLEESIVASLHSQLAKFIRRIQALPDGRHEIIVTTEKGLRDWTVRTIGKVEK
jgi:hypothetical protein